MTKKREYDAADNGRGCYELCLRLKREAADFTYPQRSPDQQLGLDSSGLEGIASSIRRNPSLDGLSQGNSRTLAGGTIAGPVIRHQDFCCSLDRVHVDALPAEQDGNGRGKPGALRHGGEA